MAPKQRKTLGPKPAVAKGSARATSVSAAKKGKATGSALREKTNVKAGSSGAPPPFDETLEPHAITSALAEHIDSCACALDADRMNGWFEEEEEADADGQNFYHDASELVNRVDWVGVSGKRHVGQCHVALLTLAEVTDEMESVRPGAEHGYTYPFVVGRASSVLSRMGISNQIRLVWRDLLRVAAGLEGGVTDLDSDYIQEDGVAPLDQMIADALAYKCDVLNEFATGHEAECGGDAESCKAARDFMAGRRKRLQEKATGSGRWEGSMDPKYRDPLPVELIPDPKLRVGARKLAKAVAGAKAVPSNYEPYEG
ncbi:unnamed protein product [Pedinophyceae sp. YPF-701]|nr:unnamed protein product [Pedinophyceae sp. YPF-701]